MTFVQTSDLRGARRRVSKAPGTATESARCPVTRRPVPSKPSPRGRVSGDGAGLRAKYRRFGVYGIGTQRPCDLDEAWLRECREVAGRRGLERDVRFPGLRDSADDKLTVGDFGKNAPSKRLHGRQQIARLRTFVMCRTEGDLSRPDDCPHDRRVKQILLPRRGHRNTGRSGNTDVMTFDDLIRWHELVEQLIALMSVGARDASVSPPCDSGVRAVCADSDAGSCCQEAHRRSDPPFRVHAPFITSTLAVRTVILRVRGGGNARAAAATRRSAFVQSDGPLLPCPF